MSQTTLYGLILCVALLAAGVWLLANNQPVLGGMLITAALGAAGLGKQAADANKPGSSSTGALLLAAALMCAVPAKAQDIPPAPSLLDLGVRGHVTANAGAMVLTTGDDWSGASLGGTVLYNLHPKLSAFVAYDHGFPVNDVDQHLNVWRAVGSLRVHPNAFLGFGYAWFSKDVEGGLVQLVIKQQFAKRVEIAGSYAHVFARDALDDFEYAKVGVNYHLFGHE